MTKEEVAAQLDGTEYPVRMSKDQQEALKLNGLVVLIGASDDLAEFYGAIRDEVGFGSNGGEILLLGNKVLEDHEYGCDCKYCGFAEVKSQAAVMSKDSAARVSWSHAGS